MLAALAGCVRTGSVEAEAGRETRRLPVLMYHSVLKDPKRAGTYVVSPDCFESDLKYLLQTGYTTVTAMELIAFADGTGALPEKPVLITFDDGYYNNYIYILPILERYRAHAVINVVGSFCDIYSQTPDPNPNYAHVSWDEVRLLSGSGYVEIGNHTYDMHGNGSREGCLRLAGEEEEHYRSALMRDIGAMQAALWQRSEIRSAIFAYPYGRQSQESEEVLGELGFRCVLTCREKMNQLVRGEKDCLMNLGRYNRPAYMTTEAFMSKCLSLN